MRRMWFAYLLLLAMGLRFAPAQSGPEKRVIEDAATGKCWVLERDAMRPAGPGRLVQQKGANHLDPDRDAKRGQQVVIHAGDHVNIADDSAVVDVKLEGVAMAAARSGEIVKVKLSGTGWTVRAEALAAGRMRLIGEAR